MIFFPNNIKRVLITGGAGFIGGALIRRLLNKSSVKIFNLDKIGYASDLKSINNEIKALGESGYNRHQLLKVDLADINNLNIAIQNSDPDLVFHLAAESHVDRSIRNPFEFIQSNILGTFNLLQAIRSHWDSLPTDRKERFCFHHISTDEVFGSLGPSGRFSETSQYDPRSPYSASKASSDHLVNAWHHSYGLPVIITNCSNNYGPWQFPEKLIPVIITKALAGEEIPIYGDGMNIRDWLFVEDHIDGILLAALNGKKGNNYCIGGSGELTNNDVAKSICLSLDKIYPERSPHSKLIRMVRDRPGHDRRYAIDAKRIKTELGWHPKYTLNDGISNTVNWYINNQTWCKEVIRK